MEARIKTVMDIEMFAKQLISEDVNFHPDDDFRDIISLADNKPFYSVKEAEERNQCMQQCFDLSEKEGFDIYSVMLDVKLKETGLDKFIPLPSANEVLF